jgi:hypothetical protein
MPQSDQGRSVAGSIALIVIGFLIFVPSGLCTGVMAIGPLVYSVLHPSQNNGDLSMLPVALTIGLPFVTLGGVMIYAGVSRMRAKKKLPDNTPDQFL